MNQLIKISIIIPCYNCETLVDETLTSLVAQTKKDFEVICINDGSTDQTLNKLQQWVDKGTLNLRILSQENKGVSSARNAGIQAAIGEYLLFLDADDCYHSQFVERLYDVLEQSGADVSYCKLSRSYDKVMNCVLPSKKYLMQSQTEAMNNLMYHMGEFGFYCYLYRKSILQQEALHFDINTKYFEDREFNWKYLCNCQSAAMIDAPLYWYRITTNSATQKKATTWRTDSIEAAKRIEEYLKTKSCAFYSTLKNYLYPRIIWSNAKKYALSNNREFFDRLGQEYDVKGCMKKTTKDKNKLVAISSICYRIHPTLFYKIVRLKKRF